jgi:large subunit ribosomal protein L28
MAQVCQICGKGPQFGNNISHAHNVSRRRWSVNLRPVKAKVEGGAKRMRVCTSCIKSGKVVKAYFLSFKKARVFRSQAFSGLQLVAAGE